MRFTFVILLFLSLGADAQMIIKAHANYRPYAVAVAQNLLLDDYPNAAAAYSLRKLDKDYTGSAIRVRRSNDNSEQDIGFTSAGDLDTASLKTFVGANSGFVTTWYDQSGNARNATQTTAANQPRIVNAGTVERRSNKVAIFNDGSNDNLSTGYSNTTSITSIHVNHIISNNDYGVYSNNGGIYQLAIIDGNAWGFLSRSTTAAVVTLSPTTGYFTGNYSNVTNSTILTYTHWNSTDRIVRHKRNNESELTSSTTGTTLRTTGNAQLFYQSGYSLEWILYPSNQSSNRTGIETNINSYYGIY